MNSVEQCAFCDVGLLRDRLVREYELFFSIVSKPRFREDHCLVIPKRHITQPGELTQEEAGAVLLEAGRLALLLDRGYGTGLMQKYQPTQAENGIKVNHLHFHVFPRFEDEHNLFPVPQPNSFDGFEPSPQPYIDDLVARLR